MAREIKIGDRMLGDGHAAFIVAEIGINHNGDLEIAKQLIHAAKEAGVDSVKFQKRTPELCTPPDQRNQMRETPWGYITYFEYRKKVEFGELEYREIDQLCQKLDIMWFASVWDEEAVNFMEKMKTVCYKMPSASLTDHALLRKVRSTGKPILLSTGMSTINEIDKAVEVVGRDNLLICHATSSYPCDPTELNLRMIETLRDKFPTCPIGYSGHEVGLITSVVAVALGACLVERHFTLDRAMWGSDQSASVEPTGFQRLVKYVRVTEESLGDGVKKVYESEKPSMKRLRRVYN
jgi:N-acetylneuraminate synthase